MSKGPALDNIDHLRHTECKLRVGTRILGGVPDVTAAVRPSFQPPPQTTFEYDRTTHLYSKSPIENTLAASSSDMHALVELQGKGCPLQVLDEKVSKKWSSS